MENDNQEVKLNLFQRINAIRKSIGYIQKNKNVSTGGGSYKAVTHDVVTALLREHLIEHGIVCIPNLIESQSEPKEDGAKQFRYSATYSFEFVNADDPSDRLSIVIEAHAMDNADKAPGKAISYAKKYAVLKLFEIETGEDEESQYQPPDTIDESQIANLFRMIKETGSDAVKFMKLYEVSRIEDMPVSKYADAVAKLEIKKSQKAAQNGNAPA